MEHTEPWQVYGNNGQPIEGASVSRQQLSQDQSIIIGGAHVWIWRKLGDTIEILLQKRSSSKKTWAGYMDISAAGYIDAGETPTMAAVREANEEIGIALNQEELHYIFSLRTPLSTHEFDTVFLYRLDNEDEFTFNDGEVESLTWVNVVDFEKMSRQPDEHNLVPQGVEYFGFLLSNIHRLSI